MSQLTFTAVPCTHLSPSLAAEAAELLSWGYTRWQSNPGNTNPLKTDTSPEAYQRILRQGDLETVLCRDGGTLVAVFLNGPARTRKTSTLRKMSFIAARPLERGFEPLKAIFRGFAAFSAQNGEDVTITTDLDQATLNSLLEEAGFREITGRNETYFILSHMLARKLIASRRVRGDFLIDEIITVDGRAIRRNKKLYKLQTTPVSPYDQYRGELEKRLARCIPETNRQKLTTVFRGGKPILFVNGYYDSLVDRDRSRGGFDTGERIFGPWKNRDMAGLADGDRGVIRLKPRDLDAVRAVAARAVFRAGLFDFMTYTLGLLGSTFVATGAPRAEVDAVLSRTLHPEVPLKLADMVEEVFALDLEPVPNSRTMTDGEERTAYRLKGPYAGLENGRLAIRKRLMVEEVLARRKDADTPVVYLAGHEDEAEGVVRLFEEARDRKAPVLVFDFGTDLTRAVMASCLPEGPEACPHFSMVGAQDFYQIPVMLELLGLNPDQEFGLDLKS